MLRDRYSAARAALQRSLSGDHERRLFDAALEGAGPARWPFAEAIFKMPSLDLRRLGFVQQCLLSKIGKLGSPRGGARCRGRVPVMLRAPHRGPKAYARCLGSHLAARYASVPSGAVAHLSAHSAMCERWLKISGVPSGIWLEFARRDLQRLEGI